MGHGWWSDTSNVSAASTRFLIHILSDVPMCDHHTTSTTPPQRSAWLLTTHLLQTGQDAVLSTRRPVKCIGRHLFHHLQQVDLASLERVEAHVDARRLTMDNGKLNVEPGKKKKKGAEKVSRAKIHSPRKKRSRSWAKNSRLKFRAAVLTLLPVGSQANASILSLISSRSQGTSFCRIWKSSKSAAITFLGFLVVVLSTLTQRKSPLPCQCNLH